MTDTPDDIEPLFVMSEDKYYVGIWFLASAEGRDWMAVVYKVPDEPHFRLFSRFRYYADPDEKAGFDPFDGKDTKRVLESVFENKTEDESIAVVDGLMNELVKAGWCGSRLPWAVRKYRHKNLVRGDYDKMRHVMMGLPYVHMTTRDQLKR